MPPNAEYIKGRIVNLYQNLLVQRVNFGIYSKISRLLLRENLIVSRSYVQRTVKTFLLCGKLFRDRKNGRPNRLSSNQNIRRIINNCMETNDEITANEIQLLLENHGYRRISKATINRIRRSIGWSLKSTRYCQMVRENNKPKILQWAQQQLNDNFQNVIWTDETSVIMEQYKKRCYRKRGFAAKRKPKPKHPLKVHVWGGISKKGRTNICIFKGTMDAAFYVNILKDTLVPFIHENFRNGHRFMQDNDPKHTSRLAKSFFEENNINWWKTPAGKINESQIETL